MDLNDVLLILAGGAAKGLAQRRAEARQNELAGLNDAYARRRAAETQAATQRYTSALVPEARQASFDAAKTDITAGLNTALNEAMPAERDYAGVKGGAYTGMKTNLDAERAARIKRAFDQLSTMGAVGEQQRGTQRVFSGAARDTSAANEAATAVGQRYANAIGTVRPNPYLWTAGDALVGAGLSKRRKPAAIPQSSYAAALHGMEG